MAFAVMNFPVESKVYFFFLSLVMYALHDEAAHRNVFWRVTDNY